jgi:hypothetical protein
MRPSATRRVLLGAFVALLLPVMALATPIKTQGTWYGSNGWDGTLRGRDTAGNPINLLNAAGDAPNPALKYVYDTVLDLTWLADWNAGAGSSFAEVGGTGEMTWVNANAWVGSLLDVGGGWSLPTVLDIGNDGCNFGYDNTDCGWNVYGDADGRRDSPLAHMFYDTLGNLGYAVSAGVVQDGWGLGNTGPFVNMQGVTGSAGYWSASLYASAVSGEAWYFDMGFGPQAYTSKDYGLFAVAVRPGDVFAGSVPEPGGLALLGLAFGALVVVRRWAH